MSCDHVMVGHCGSHDGKNAERANYKTEIKGSWDVGEETGSLMQTEIVKIARGNRVPCQKRLSRLPVMCF